MFFLIFFFFFYNKTANIFGGHLKHESFSDSANRKCFWDEFCERPTTSAMAPRPVCTSRVNHIRCSSRTDKAEPRSYVEGRHFAHALGRSPARHRCCAGKSRRRFKQNQILSIVSIASNSSSPTAAADSRVLASVLAAVSTRSRLV